MSASHGHSGNTLELDLVTPRGRVEVSLGREVDDVTAPGVAGELGLLPGHLPLLTAIRPGVLKVKRGRETALYLVGPGYIEVGPYQVSVLTSSCELITEVAAAEIASGARPLQGFDETLFDEEDAIAPEEPASHGDGHGSPAH